MEKPLKVMKLNEEENIMNLLEKLKTKTYQPQPVKQSLYSEERWKEETIRNSDY